MSKPFIMENRLKANGCYRATNGIANKYVLVGIAFTCMALIHNIKNDNLSFVQRKTNFAHFGTLKKYQIRI